MLNSESFQLAVHAHFAPYKNTSFLLAISGGVDSMVLLHLFKSLGLQCQVAHLNYQLRENDSEEDQKLVERVCEHYNIGSTRKVIVGDWYYLRVCDVEGIK